MHKMSDLLFLYTEMLTLRMATSTLLNFSATYQLLLLVGCQRNLSRTFIHHDCHRRKSAGVDEGYFLSVFA